MPKKLIKIAEAGGFCMFHDPPGAQTYDVVDYTAFLNCDLLLFWYFNNKEGEDADYISIIDAAPAATATTQVATAAAGMDVTADGPGVAPAATPPQRLTYTEFLVAYKSYVNVSGMGPNER